MSHHRVVSKETSCRSESFPRRDKAIGRPCRRHGMITRWLRICAAWALAATLVACGRGHPAPATGSGAPPPIGYSPARWRLVSFQEINRTVLWVSHIVIMHRESNAADPIMRPVTWRPDPPMPARTDAEALSRALMVADLAAKDPGAFDELARRYSDDVVTRDHGGSLGGIRAGQLPQEYRDALAVLRPGETSRVVKTALGYDVIKRRPAPEDGQVAGKRIVIRYQGTLGGPNQSPSDRTRQAAQELASRVADEARSDPARFDDLVRRYSENLDAAQSGDMGVWSVRDPGFLPRQIERLSELRVGEVAPPLESIFGFEVLLRTPAENRPEYAMAAVQLQYDASLADQSEHSAPGALKLAAQLARTLHKDPSLFDSLRAKYCCQDAQKWSKGRGPVGVETVLDTLKTGEIAGTPVQGLSVYLIPMRLAPSTVQDQPPPLYDLPNPPRPDLDDIVKTTDGRTLAFYIHNLSGEIEKLGVLSDAEAKTTATQLAELAAALEKEPNSLARVDRLHAAFSSLRAALGPKVFERFESFLNDWSSRMYLGQRGPRLAAFASLKKP